MKKLNKKDIKLEEVYSFLDKKPALNLKEKIDILKKEKLKIDKNDTEIIKTYNKEQDIELPKIIFKEISDTLETKKDKIPSAVELDMNKKDEQIISESSNTSDLMRAFDSLSNPINMESNTILTNKQVIALSMINWASQIYDIEFFKHFVQLFPRYRISGDDGRGRKELIQIAEAIQKDRMEQNNRFMELLGRR